MICVGFLDGCATYDTRKDNQYSAIMDHVSTVHLHAFTCRTYDHMIIYLCLYIIALFGNIQKKSAFGHADVGVTFLTYDVYIRVILSMDTSLRKLTSIERWCSTISGNTSFRVFLHLFRNPPPLWRGFTSPSRGVCEVICFILGEKLGFHPSQGIQIIDSWWKF